MDVGSVLKKNRTQAVRLPAESRFPENVKKVVVFSESNSAGTLSKTFRTTTTAGMLSLV